MFETAPLAGMPTVRPSETKSSGDRRALRARAAVQASRERVVGVERREDARFVAGCGQLGGERLDVARDATGYVHEYGDSSAIRTAQLYPPTAVVGAPAALAMR